MKRMTATQIEAKFGNPAGRNGKVNPNWYQENIVTVPMPFPMKYGEKEVRTCLLHRKAADAFVSAMTEVWEHCREEVKAEARPALRSAVKKDYGYDHDSKWYDAEVEKRMSGLGSVYWDHETLERLQELGLTAWGGSYNYRNTRGATSLSMHAYAIAFDIDTKHNALGTKGRFFKAEYAPYVAIYERYGFYWGGRFRRKDGMHFEMTAV